MKAKIILVSLFLVSLFFTSHFFSRSEILLRKTSLTFSPVFAQEVSSPSSDVQVEEKIEYQLPYPGLLPNNPLYFFKSARDKIVGFLISDPLKKSEFNLLQADKKINSGYYLFIGREEDRLIFSEISDSLEYLEKSLEKAKEAKKQGKDSRFIFEKISKSSRKHEEILQELEKKGNDSQKKFFKEYKENILELEKKVSLL